jgi:hypothetical protein
VILCKSVASSEFKEMTMSVWSREIAGWVLMIASAVLFYETLSMVANKRVFSAGPYLFIAFVVFRGALHLLKVASAARAAREIHQAAKPPAKRVVRMGPNTATMIGVPRPNVVPGSEPAASK